MVALEDVVELGDKLELADDVGVALGDKLEDDVGVALGDKLEDGVDVLLGDTVGLNDDVEVSVAGVGVLVGVGLQREDDSQPTQQHSQSGSSPQLSSVSKLLLTKLH